MEILKPNKNYKSIHSLVYSCQYHVIFCPKYRRKVLIDGIEERLKSLILEKQSDYKYSVLEMEIMPDHVHLLLDVNPQIGIIKIIAQIKGFTAHTLRKEFSILRSRLPCLWTRSKFVSTVGAVSLETVQQYIVDQKGK
jgi:putative transposase